MSSRGRDVSFATGPSDFVVRIDGVELGRVERAERAEFTVEPGEHTVDVSMDWGWLRPRRVVVETRTRAELTIGGGAGGALKLALPMLLAIAAAVVTLAMLRQMNSFTDANWLLRSAAALVGFAPVLCGYLFATRKLGRAYWDYWAVYTLKPVGTATATHAEPGTAPDPA